MKNRTNVRWLTQLALLVAILLVLNYTPLGYLQIGPLSASLLTVPVAIGAMTMNPMAGAILGGVFGATSFIQAVEGKSALGAALFQVSPAGTFVVCFVARVLMGLCTALIFNALRKAMPKNEKLACFLGGLSAPVLNTVFFMGSLVLIFYLLLQFSHPLFIGRRLSIQPLALYQQNHHQQTDYTGNSDHRHFIPVCSCCFSAVSVFRFFHSRQPFFPFSYSKKHLS